MPNFDLVTAWLKERLRHYSRKVQKLQSADYLARHRPSVTLNIAAASRFIDNAVPDLCTQQKAALRQVRSFVGAMLSV